MAKQKNSQQWLDVHEQDEYVLRARREGLRGRAVYKLKELDEKYRLIRPDMMVIDLGAAPGSWSEYVAKQLNDTGKIIATDILPMDSIAGVEFIQGDFREDDILDVLLNKMGDRKADLVICDMAPNLSGIASVDMPASFYLSELALDLAQRISTSGADMLIKLFQGEGFDDYLAAMRKSFQKVIIRKPNASRSPSREVYALARGFDL